MKEKCLTQEELAKELGLKQSSISDMVSGKRDTIRLAIEISEKYNIDRNVLLGDDTTQKEIEQNQISERINELISDSCLTYRKFAIMVGIDPGNFTKKRSAIQPWTIGDVNKICSNLNIRKGWLINGEGQKFKAPEEMLDAIPAKTKEQDSDILKNAADLFTDQALRAEKFIVMLSNEISEVRAIKEELQKQKEHTLLLQQQLHDAIFALRSAIPNSEYRPLMAADDIK